MTYRCVDNEFVKSHDGHAAEDLEHFEVSIDEAAEDVEVNVVAAIDGAKKTSVAHVELYDSGSMCHLSPASKTLRSCLHVCLRPPMPSNLMI